jgi:ATP-binding cassette subfamily B protein
MFDDDLHDEETPSTGSRGLKLVPRIWPYFRKYLRTVIVAGLALTASAVMGLLGPVLVRHAIDVDIAPGNVTDLMRTAVFYLLLEIGIAVAGFLQAILLARVGQNAVADLKENLYSHVIRLPAGFFDRNPVGRLMTRTESDAESLHQLFSTTVVTLAQNVVMLLGMAVVMCFVNWKLFLLVFALLPVLGFVLYRLQNRTRGVYVAVRRTVARINNLISEVLRALPVVQAFCREDYFTARLDRLNEQQYRQEERARTMWFWIWFLLDSGEVLGLALVLGAGGLWALKGWITIGGLFLFYSYITRLFGPLRALSNQANVIQRAFASAERIFGIFDTAPEPVGTGGKFTGLERNLELDGVDFSYEGREQALKRVSLAVRKGERVALVGETGGGKTSIVSLVMKFYEPQSGQVLLDGTDLRELDTCSLRRGIGFVPQDVILFPGTILDNLRLFDDTVPEDRVHDAAKRARLHERILQFPEGYATNLAERGINLSLGERQLLAFARAMVSDPDILILDEATSSVDPQTEAMIQEGLEELTRGRTAIIIAHRLATIRMVDRILVVHQGEITQQGRHEQLLAEEGYYRRLYRLQYLNAEA